MKILLVIVGCALGIASAQTPGCDYYKMLQPGQEVLVKSPNYKNSYPRGIMCRWVVECPNAKCRAECNDINIPYTVNCQMDRLLIAINGDETLNSGQSYCGTGSQIFTSTGSKIAIGLVTSSSSTGGYFQCRVVSSQAFPSCSCGYKKANRIVGGVETGVNEYPMMAGLYEKSTDRIICGAVIIDKMYLLTAAHCLYGKNKANYNIQVGLHNLRMSTPGRQVHEIQDVRVHNLYNSNNNDYDIAIIMLKTNIAFSDIVGPVCLPFNLASRSYVGQKLTALGWGLLFFGGPPSGYLQKVDLDVISDSECSSRGATVTPRQICTFTPGKDTCQQDSGGPLLYTNPQNGLLYSVAIASYGAFCAQGPGINTKVPALLDWIVSYTPYATYCVK